MQRNILIPTLVLVLIASLVLAYAFLTSPAGETLQGGLAPGGAVATPGRGALPPHTHAPGTPPHTHTAGELPGAGAPLVGGGSAPATAPAKTVVLRGVGMM